MASKKQHPHIGKFYAAYAGNTQDYNDRPHVYDTAESALEEFRLGAEEGNNDEGDVVYVYAIVGVKQIKKPTLTENLIEDPFL